MSALNFNHPQRKTLRARGRLALEAPRHGGGLDLIIGDKVVVELKVVKELAPVFEAQLLTYMRLIECRVGLLMDFNVLVLKDGIKRLVL
jgi:GxxExxY protein